MSKRSNLSEAQSRTTLSSNASFSSSSVKGAPSPLKPERPRRQHSDPDLRNVKPANGRVAPYPDCRKVWDADDWWGNSAEDPDGRDVAMMKTLGRQLHFINTAQAFKARSGSQTSRKMSEQSTLSGSTGGTNSAFSTRSGTGSQRSQSAGSVRSSASRSSYSARSARSASSFGEYSDVDAPLMASMALQETLTYPNPGRVQVFIDDPSLRLQKVHAYKRSAFGGGFTWTTRSPAEVHHIPASKYGFQPSSCEKPLKENCSRSNPDRSGPGFSRTPYGGFYVRHRDVL